MGDIVQLSFSGHGIRAEGEMLCLTDMWRADGKPSGLRPSHWAQFVTVQGYIKYLKEIDNVRDTYIIRTQRGRTGGTWAHWKIAIAYAQDLSPGFKDWCTEVVRAHMEGRATPSTGIQHLAPEAREVLEKVVDEGLRAIRRQLNREASSITNLEAKVWENETYIKGNRMEIIESIKQIDQHQTEIEDLKALTQTLKAQLESQKCERIKRRGGGSVARIPKPPSRGCSGQGKLF